MNTPLIQAENISLFFGQLQLFKQLNFTIEQGKAIGLLGPNGAGKSTLLKMICGLCPPQQGTIKLSDKNLYKHSEELKQKIGYLPDQVPLYPHLTIDENLWFVARIKGLSKPHAQRECIAVKKLCSLNKIGNALFGHLSAGMQRRVGLAQALINSPSLIALDEPTADLDPEHRRRILELIKNLKTNHTVIFSTHIMSDITYCCDYALFIKDGKINMLRPNLKGVYSEVVMSKPDEKAGITEAIA